MEAIQLALQNRAGIEEKEFKEAIEVLTEITEPDKEVPNFKWLSDVTEKWCKERAIYNGIMECIHIIDDNKDTSKKKKVEKTPEAIPDILAKALSVSFDKSIGHDYIVDSDDRYSFYHRVEQRIPFDLDYFNRITEGGLSRKSVMVLLGRPNIGKTLVMCHMAAAALSSHHNVLYITLEMEDKKIGKRIDANLLNISMKDLSDLPKANYDKKIDKLKETIKGKLVIKEYPTATAGSAHFRHLLNELSLKKQFKPDIIFVDYLNICTSARFKPGNGVNSYTYIKSITEELRGLAVEQDVALVSATQTTRSGGASSDPDMDDTSESYGLPATVDILVAIIRTDELDAQNQIQIKQIKNRDNDVDQFKKFVVGIDKHKMRLFDVVDQPNFTTSTAEDIYKSVGKKETGSDVRKVIDDNIKKYKDWQIDTNEKPENSTQES